MQQTDSICIPRIESSISKTYIKTKLDSLHLGHILQIREIPLQNDNNYKRIIIQLRWLDTRRSKDIQQKLAEIGSIKLVYDMPWYWKIVPTRT